MAERPIWFIRAGAEAAYADDFLNQGFVGLGWSELGPISPNIDDEDLDSLMERTYPDHKPNTRTVWASHIRRFLREVRIGDTVVTYDRHRESYFIGTIDSDVEWHDGHPNPRWRRVTWQFSVPRDRLSQSARNKLGSIATLFRVGDEAEAELLQNRQPLTRAAEKLLVDEELQGKESVPLEPKDFDVLKRNPKSIPWRSLPDADQAAIRALREKLKSYAEDLARSASTFTRAVTVKPFVSILNPSGRNAKSYWCCVYPDTAPNKSFAFQLFVIVTGDGVEIGFGPGSGTAEQTEEALAELIKDFRKQQAALAQFRDWEFVGHLEQEVRHNGFEMSERWIRDGQGRTFTTIADWIDYATSEHGGGASISKFISKEAAIAKGDTFSDWISQELDTFWPLIVAIYTGDPPVRVGSDLRKGAAPVITQASALTIAWLEEQTLWPRSELETILESLNGGTPQVILAGPPGTSKTWVAELLARFITQDRPNQRRTVQFHPSYSYEEFIEGLRPLSKGGAISFEVRPGTVLQMSAGLKSSKDKRVLIIDEMNRANVPRVFGELLYLLEYRGKAIELQYSSGFELPDNLVFIGTMNTADRSIRSIDVALRRRFDLFECQPKVEILERFYSERSNEVGSLLEGFSKLNSLLSEHLDRHHTIGHAFLMAETMTPQRLARIWRLKIEPLIEEYFFDQPDLLTEFRLAQFWPEAADAN